MRWLGRPLFLKLAQHSFAQGIRISNEVAVRLRVGVERFKRMWQYYLSYCEGGFRAGRTDVSQIVLEAA